MGALGPSPVDIDEVARATGVAVRKVHIVLLEPGGLALNRPARARLAPLLWPWRADRR
ncbi:hypothetical protein [Methyloceanibacter sp.]|uniref:DprA-like winged helix domain-containing protein n=1 Tax=Methyloceanibacter sp. TaxID=1965321 RepID=UPI003C74F217